jgi:hypothetical protein
MWLTPSSQEITRRHKRSHSKLQVTLIFKIGRSKLLVEDASHKVYKPVSNLKLLSRQLEWTNCNELSTKVSKKQLAKPNWNSERRANATSISTLVFTSINLVSPLDRRQQKLHRESKNTKTIMNDMMWWPRQSRLLGKYHIQVKAICWTS